MKKKKKNEKFLELSSIALRGPEKPKGTLKIMLR